jgi:hypothetical protein
MYEIVIDFYQLYMIKFDFIYTSTWLIMCFLVEFIRLDDMIRYDYSHDKI